MLCRVADSLFWLGRYMERAENTVRLVEVNQHSMLEQETTSDDKDYLSWRSLLSSLGDRKLFESLYETHSSYNVSYFLTFDKENPSSVLSCIAAARENARMIRDQISVEMWETINRMYLYLNNTDAEYVCRELDFNFYKRIKEFTLLFQGIKEVTFNHKLGYEFLTCGYEIERADKTCRILDAKRYLRKLNSDDGAIENAQWSAVLRACSAYEAYHHEFAKQVAGNRIASFLLLSRDFPRSVLFCLNRLQMAMHAISDCPVTHFSNESERQIGVLISKLKYMTPDSLEASEVKKVIKEIETALSEITLEFCNEYMFSEITDPAKELLEVEK
jgi:uncharacterized alpha-E superfamily protein